MSDSILGMIHKQLEEYKSSIALYLAEGGAKSHEEYLKLTGKYEGFERVQSDISEIEKRYIDS